MKDALGNPIEIEKYYGYSRIKNGIVHVVTGRAIKVEDDRIKLDNIIEQWGVYGNPDLIKKTYKSRMVYSRTVFPIDITTLNLPNS